MQLKKQGSSYSVIRTTYDPTEGVKRGVQRSLGTIPLGSVVIPEKIATQLTPDELSDVQQKLNSFAEESKEESAKLSVFTLPISISRAIDFINENPKIVDENKAAELYKKVAELKLALRKAGFRRPRPAAAAAPAALGAGSKPAGKQQKQGDTESQQAAKKPGKAGK